MRTMKQEFTATQDSMGMSTTFGPTQMGGFYHRAVGIVGDLPLVGVITFILSDMNFPRRSVPVCYSLQYVQLQQFHIRSLGCQGNHDCEYGFRCDRSTGQCFI